MITEYNKAIMALLAGLVNFAAVIGLEIDWVYLDETVAALATLLSVALVYLVPNKPPVSSGKN